MPCWLLIPLVWKAKVLARLPPSFLLALSGFLAFALRPFMRRRQKVAARNLELCFPQWDEAARARLLHANLRETFMGGFELLRAWYAPAWRLRGCARVEGLEHLREALAAGQGVLLFTGHFTQTELAVRLLSDALAKPLRGVVRRNNSACLETEFERARQRVFGPTLAKKDVRGLLRALQHGQIIAYSADQDFSYGHAFVPFFGVAAATLTGTAELARRGGARVLPFWFHRDSTGIYHLRVEAEWPQWRNATPEQSAAIYMRELEAVVRERPEQYLWVHRRFKTRPPGAAPVY
jgi:KDO2-lipid IV(A) lauroyltransferase